MVPEEKPQTPVAGPVALLRESDVPRTVRRTVFPEAPTPRGHLGVHAKSGFGAANRTPEVPLAGISGVPPI